MITSIELQVISKILTSDDTNLVDKLCEFDESYYSVFKSQIEFILDHRSRYNDVPDVFTFQAEFPDITLVSVSESYDYLAEELQKNKKHIILLETFNKLKDLGSGDVDDAWEYIDRQCERVQSLDSTKPMDIVHDAKKRSQQVIEFSNQARIPTGFPEIDKLMYGGLSTVEELLIILARTNTGKAQPLWSNVLTPSGWKTMGDIQLGDVVIGKNNDNGKVIKIFPQGEKDYYRITFNDNSYTECCDDHLWEVLDDKRRQRADSNYGKHLVLTTKEIRNSLDRGYTIDISDAIAFNVDFDESNELDGYLLGVILGDGCTRDNTISISNVNKELWKRIDDVLIKYNCTRGKKDNSSIRGVEYGKNFVRDKIVEYGLMNVKSIDKFIPKQYLTAPIHVRKALLAGLLDTDGYIENSPNGRSSWEFDTSSEQLASDFAELARSLGVFVKVYDRKPSGYRSNGIYHKGNGIRHLLCRSEFNPFYISIKANRYNFRENTVNRSHMRRNCKKIVSIEYAGKTECQCILLDNESHTYITDNYILTHNSWVCTKMMESAQANGFPCLYYSPEMQASFLGTRFDTWRGHFQNSQLYRGNYSEEYWNYIRLLEKEETPAFILEDKDVAEGAVNTKVLSNLIKEFGIKLCIIDGLSYLEDTKSKYNDTDYIKYKNICMDLFKMSKRYGCAVVISMQANRETKDMKDDKGEVFPNLYAAEGSDHPARIATQAFAIRQIFDKHVLDIRLEKTRMANNQKPVLSYSWDVNTGRMTNIQGEASPSDPVTAAITPVVTPSVTMQNIDNSAVLDDDDEFDDEVEF